MRMLSRSGKSVSSRTKKKKAMSDDGVLSRKLPDVLYEISIMNLRRRYNSTSLRSGIRYNRPEMSRDRKVWVVSFLNFFDSRIFWMNSLRSPSSQDDWVMNDHHVFFPSFNTSFWSARYPQTLVYPDTTSANPGKSNRNSKARSS